MKFVSKLYFNTFKRIGNLRLMFVVSCFFAVISVLVVTTYSVYKVKIIDINNISLQETLEAYTPHSELFLYNKKLHNYIEIMENTDTEKRIATNLIVMRKYCEAGQQKEAYEFAEEHLKGIFSEIHCPTNKPLPVEYSIGYLWNYLWVIFWFYLPFILILPIKFIIDGYKQDKTTSKVIKRKKHD